jgi:hypothetical protein
VKSKTSKSLFAVAIAFWITLVGCGIASIWNYQNTPGAQGKPPAQWPQASRIKPNAQLPTLVLVIHPHCPCSRATIGELALLMAHTQGLVNANVFFVKPQGFSDDWEKTDLWKSAASIPGVIVMTDENGIEASRFKSKTSGQVMLYDVNGRLVFSGGITNSRGHSGDNEGRSALLSLLTTGTASNKESPVFGCSLSEVSSQRLTEEFCNGVHPK